MGRYINPFTDIGFKIVFGQEASKPLLLNFLNSLLKGAEQIVDITYSDKEQVTYNEEDRTLIYDVLCTTSTGEKIIVEMQNKKQTYFMNIFKNMSKLDQFPWTINNPVFREWEDRSRVANLKGGLRDQYERALKHYRDAYSIYETATEEGRAEGIAQGIAQGERSKSIDIAQKLKAMNMSIEQIIEATGLTADEIAEI